VNRDEKEQALFEERSVMKWFAHAVRRSPRMAWFAYLIRRGVAPSLACVLVGSLAITAAGGRWAWHRLHRYELDPGPVVDPAAHDVLTSGRTVEFEFHTDQPYAATPYWVEENITYLVRCQAEDWQDDTYPASPDGLIVAEPENAPSPVVHGLQSWLKRDVKQPIFKLMAGIGPDAEAMLAIGAEGRWVAPRSGRLHLFVNDVPGFYGNNQGTAKVFITPLPPTDPNDEG